MMVMIIRINFLSDILYIIGCTFISESKKIVVLVQEVGLPYIIT